MTEIIVIGGGGHARVVLGVLRALPTYEIRGYVALSDAGLLDETPFLGGDEFLETFSHGLSQPAAALAVGQMDCGDRRSSILNRLAQLGFDMPVLISPGAILRGVEEVGDGTFVGDGVIVNSGARVGRCCILNTRSLVEHDCLLGDLVHIAPGAILGGGVNVGHHSLIGLGATVRDHVTIPPRTIVGAGATVVADIMEPGVYVGCPAKRLK